MSPTRRLSAIVALVAVVAMLAVAVVGLLQRPLVLVVAIACLGVAIGAASYALTRTGARRLLAAVVAILALAAPLALVVAYGRLLRLLQLLLLVALVAVAGVATRHALGRDLKSLKSGPTPGTIVGPAVRPVLLMNPKSGGGRVGRFNLVEEARRRGIEPVVLGPGDDLLELAERAVAGGADVVGMAGGDGSQALVAGVASTWAWSATGCSSTTPPWACTPRSCSPPPTATTRSTPPWSCCQSCWGRTPPRSTCGSPAPTPHWLVPRPNAALPLRPGTRAIVTAVVGGALLSPGHGRVLTGGPLLRRGLRQLAIGVAAAAVT